MSELPPVVVSVEVPGPLKIAFEVFTESFGSWWPHLSHSVGGSEVAEVVMEARIGGRLYERWKDGTERDWGRIEVFDPPTRLAFSWDPGGRRRETDVEVVFSEASSGDTIVELTHSNWHVIGDEAEELRSSYVDGWPTVLTAFTAFAREDG